MEISQEIKKRLFDELDSKKEEMVSLLSRLIAYPSVKGEPSEGAPFGLPVRRCLDEALSTLSSWGFATECHDGYVGTAELGEGETVLGVLAHLDVVAAGDGWTGDPFTARIADGRVYGRGAIDDKGPAVAAMFALRAIKELGIPIKSGVRLILGTDEENGSSDLAYYFKKQSPPRYAFTPDGSYPVINIEKGMIRVSFSSESQPCPGGRMLLWLEGGTAVNAVPGSAYALVSGVGASEVIKSSQGLFPGVEISCKEFEGGSLRIDARGVSAHASTPESGKNAITALLGVLSRLGLEDGGSKAASRLSSIFPYGESDGLSLGIKMSDRESGALTEVLSLVSYQAGRLECSMDIRLPVSSSVGEVKSRLLPAIEGAGFKIDSFGGTEPHRVDEDGEFVKTLLEVYEEMTGDRGRCIAIGGGTYVHELEGGVAFGAEFIGEDNHMHSFDEFISIDRLVLNSKIFALAILKVLNSGRL